MKSNYSVAVLSMEMLMPEFKEPARMANSKGGLGVLTGDEARGFAKLGQNAHFIAPLYSCNGNPEERICYDSLAQKTMDLNVRGADNHFVPVSVSDISSGSVKFHGLLAPPFDFLYVFDRLRRLQQEVVFGKAAVLFLKQSGLRPDIVLANESHTAVAVSELKKDPYFKKTKVVFGLHTKHPAGLERYPGDWFDNSGISEQHRGMFIEDGQLNFVRAAAGLADGIIAVSEEFGDIAKKELLPECRDKIIGIRNGSDRDSWLSPRLKAAEESDKNIDLLKFWTIRQTDKKDLLGLAKQKTGRELRPTKPLIGWVRRITDFKNQYPMLNPIIRAICAERGEVVPTFLGELPGLGMQMFCAGVASADEYRSWTEAFHCWTKDPIFRGNFVFLEEYNFELLKATGFDLWLHCPWPTWEACGTSSQRALINGTPSLTTRTGGDMEFIQEFNPETGQGNGFYIDPYEPMTVYRKLKVFSDIYYGWLENGNPSLLVLYKNAYETGKTLDITGMLENYQEKSFAPLLSGSP